MADDRTRYVMIQCFPFLRDWGVQRVGQFGPLRFVKSAGLGAVALFANRALFLPCCQLRVEAWGISVGVGSSVWSVALSLGIVGLRALGALACEPGALVCEHVGLRAWVALACEPGALVCEHGWWGALWLGSLIWLSHFSSFILSVFGVIVGCLGALTRMRHSV